MTSSLLRPRKRSMTSMSPLIDQYLEWLRKRNSSPRTITHREGILGRINAAMPYGIEAATSVELSAWVYQDRFGPATREAYYGTVRAFFVWACNPYDPKLDFDPSALLPRPKSPRGLPRPVSDAQLRRILTESAEPYRTWALFGAYAGLRSIEIAGLSRQDITEDNLLVLAGKGGRPGVLPTHPAIWDAVKDLPRGPVAWNDVGEPANAKWVSIRTAVYFRRHLGMPGVGLHRLRHWYGTNLYRTTKDIRRTQELMRHSSPTTTAIYTLVTNEERLAAIQTLPTFSPGPC